MWFSSLNIQICQPFLIKTKGEQNFGKFEFKEYFTNNHLIVYKIGLEI